MNGKGKGAQNDAMTMREAVTAARDEFKAAVEEFTAIAETDPGEAAMAAALEALSGVRDGFKDARGSALEEFLTAAYGAAKGAGDAASTEGKMNSPVHGGSNEHLPFADLDLPEQALDGMSHGPDFLIG